MKFFVQPVSCFTSLGMKVCRKSGLFSFKIWQTGFGSRQVTIAPGPFDQLGDVGVGLRADHAAGAFDAMRGFGDCRAVVAGEGEPVA